MGLRRRECRAGVGRIDGPRVGDMGHRILFVVQQNLDAVAQCAAAHNLTAGTVTASRISGDSVAAYNGSKYADTGYVSPPTDPVTQFTICSNPSTPVSFTSQGFGGRWD